MSDPNDASQLELWSSPQTPSGGSAERGSDAPELELWSSVEGIEAPQAATFAAERPLKILVADDNEVNRRIMQAILTKLGYRCEAASDGEEALAQYESGDFDYVFMDLDMPELSGIEAAQRIRGLERRRHAEGAPRKRCEIIAVTANVSSEMRQDCKLAGMNGFLEKPITVDIVKDQLVRSWSRMRSRQAKR